MTTAGIDLITKLILGTVTENDFRSFSDDYDVLAEFLYSNEAAAALEPFFIFSYSAPYEREDDNGESYDQEMIDIYQGNGTDPTVLFKIFKDDPRGSGVYDVTTGDKWN